MSWNGDIYCWPLGAFPTNIRSRKKSAFHISIPCVTLKILCFADFRSGARDRQVQDWSWSNLFGKRYFIRLGCWPSFQCVHFLYSCGFCAEWWLCLIFYFTGDANQCMRVSSALEAGTVRDHIPLLYARFTPFVFLAIYTSDADLAVLIGVG